MYRGEGVQSFNRGVFIKTMKEKEFLSLLNDAIEITVSGKNGEIAIEPAVSINLHQNKIIRLYDEVTFGGETKKIKGDKKLIKFLTEEGAVSDGEVNVKSIGCEKLTEEEFASRRQFDSLDMEGILQRYLPLADSFSLTCPYGEENGISEELASKVLKTVKADCYRTAEEQFLYAPVDERVKLPPFEKIYKDIEKMYREYCERNAALIEANGGYACFSDVFSGEKEKYNSLPELWHAYSEVDFAGTCEAILEKMKKQENVRPLEEELEGEENRCLKENLIKTEVTFVWHCTKSSELSKVFYIKLNDDTVKWLKKFKSDYDLDLLEDLAFYKKGKLLFSSCTHERFHSDCARKN